MSGSRPTRRIGTRSSRAASTAPATVSAGAKSPPIASTATGRSIASIAPARTRRAAARPAIPLLDFGDFDDLSALVEPAMRADPVREARLVAVGAPGDARADQVVVRAALVAAG